MKSKENLMNILFRRLNAVAAPAQGWLSGALEVVVFGSMSIGLERPDSDIDVLCIGGGDGKLKTSALDLIIVPAETTENRQWLQSELASHVGEYGTWIKGSGSWRKYVRIGEKAIDEKRRRISAFMRTLPDSWIKLQECFRVKYSAKLRRETQRLILLERGVPVPPTRILDDSWNSVSKIPHDVHERLLKFASSDRHNSCVHDLLAQIDAHLDSVAKNHHKKP